MLEALDTGLFSQMLITEQKFLQLDHGQGCYSKIGRAFDRLYVGLYDAEHQLLDDSLKSIPPMTDEDAYLYGTFQALQMMQAR